MGILKTTIGGTLHDQWLEVIEADDMDSSVVFTSGKLVQRDDRKSHNTMDTGIVSDGSVIHVGENQVMILVDGGKIIDYTAEPGYFKVDNSSSPSLFNGSFGEVIMESFQRIKYGGLPPAKQEVYFINTQEIKGIKFGTKNPVNYFDNFYNSELFLRTHGNYSIKITDPLKFYREVIPKNAKKVDIEDINEQYLSEFLEALQAAINQMSVDGIRISHVTSKSRELSTYMKNVLDDDWNELRGFEIISVGIASISYDEESQALINMRNKGAMLSDAAVREGYVQGSIARGLENAGSNESGAGNAFIGMGMGMNAAGNVAGAFSQTNSSQMQKEYEKKEAEQVKVNENSWTCPACGASNTGNFCSECGSKKPEVQTAKFCTNCGAKVNNGEKFCSNCGAKL